MKKIKKIPVKKKQAKKIPVKKKSGLNIKNN